METNHKAVRHDRGRKKAVRYNSSSKIPGNAGSAHANHAQNHSTSLYHKDEASDIESEEESTGALRSLSSKDLGTAQGAGAAPEINSKFLQHMNRTDSVLLSVFPRHIAEALVAGKEVEPENHELVTMSISNIVGFEDILSTLDPLKVSDMLNRLYHSFDALSSYYDIFKVETNGDAYMVVTNLTKTQPDHCKRIAEFAIDQIKVAQKTLIDKDDPSRGYVNVRVGFHSGPVVSGVVGLKNPRYTLFGDSVSVAARMESSAGKNLIHCSDASARLLREQAPGIPIYPRGTINVKGKGNISTFWVHKEGKEKRASDSRSFFKGLRNKFGSRKASSDKTIIEDDYAASIGSISVDGEENPKKEMLPKKKKKTKAVNSDNVTTKLVSDANTDTKVASKVVQKETNASPLDAVDETRQKLEEVIDGTTDPVILKNEYILALNQEYLCNGAFGAVYKAQDVAQNWTFALKRVLYHLQDDEMRDTITDVFRTELAILSKARHPNIIRLFGYHVDSNGKNHVLLFEYAEMGSLSMLLRSERGRMTLTASRRLQILVQTASALCYLHRGGNMGSANIILHRDIKSDNICVAGSFQAKLIDCGLGKLVDDANLPLGSFVQQSHSSAFGTDGYRCPWYSKGMRTFKPACDIYSFGITMMEIIVGIVQGGSSSRKDLSVQDLRSRYLEDEKEEKVIEDGDKLLIIDSDPLAGWEEDVLGELSKLAIRACHERTKSRPTTEDLLDELSRLIHIHELGGQLGNQVVSSMGPVGAPVCHICARVPRVIRCSHGHGLCGCCLDIQIHRRLGMATIICPVGGCHSMPFKRAELEQGASAEILRAYLDRQENHVNLTTRMESIRCIAMDIHKDTGFIRGDVQSLRKGMSRTLQAIANQAAGVIEKCPRLVLLVPSSTTSTNDKFKVWLKNPLKKKVRIYLVCQHSVTTLDNPIELYVTRQWVLKVAPALKLSLMLLKIVASSISVPVPDLPEFLACGDLVEMLLEDSEAKIKDGLSELSENRLLEASDLEKLRSKIVKLVGPSYDMLSEKLLKEKRMKLWRHDLKSVLDADGNTIYVKAKYVDNYK